MAMAKRKRRPAPTASGGPRSLRRLPTSLASEVRHLRQTAPATTATEYWQLYAAASIAWVALDAYAIVRDINPAGAHALGVAAKAAIGTPLRMWVDEPGRGLVLEHARRCRSGEDPIETELPLRPRGGPPRQVRLSSRAMRFRNRLLFPSVLVDITEQNALAEARRRAEAQRDQAETERREARAADAAKDRLIATVSHELRNPLSPALVAATTLETMPGLPDAARRMARIIRRNVEIEARLIDDLLDVARATRGQMALNRATVDVHDIIGFAIEACAAAARGRDVSVTTDFQAARHHAHADAARLQQVFWNLISNAIKFTEAGGRVQISTRIDPGGVLRVTVRDSGQGMDVATLQRLFTPFEHPGKPAGGQPGLGLGLSIARSIVEQHGGLIWASSDGPGRGSTFDVDLTAVIEPAAAPMVASAAPAPEAHARRRVLIVEDHEDTSDLLAMWLSNEGYDVRVAPSLADGLSALDTAWDVVVSDIGLADGSGLEIGRRTTRLAKRPARVIALSGYGSLTDIEASRAAGFDAHLVKPIDPEGLLKALA